MLTGRSDKEAGGNDAAENDTAQNDFETETSHHGVTPVNKHPAKPGVFMMLTAVQEAS